MPYISNFPFWFARFSLFLIYFWFGILKVFTVSPANPLVSLLLSKTLPFISFDTFIFYFGIFEMIIGILFLVPKFTRAASLVLVLHLGMTTLPLFLLSGTTWSGPFIPTLEGQYIIKNVLIIAVAIFIYNENKKIWQSSTLSPLR